MVSMTFDESLHPRGQAANAGQFVTKTNDRPASSLTGQSLTPQAAQAVADAARPIEPSELLEVLESFGQYPVADIDWSGISERDYRPVTAAPSARIDQDRPSFTREGERDFRTALGRIDGVWDRRATRDARAEALIADMRRSGAMGSGGGAALEAYARAIALNETGGYIDEEQINHLLDHIAAGGADYRTHARAFGYHPEQYVSDLASAARSAAYRKVRATDDLTRVAATARRETLEAIAEGAATRLNRAWTSYEEDADALRTHVRDLDARIRDAAIDRHQVRLGARRDALAFALDKLGGTDAAGKLEGRGA